VLVEQRVPFFERVVVQPPLSSSRYFFPAMKGAILASHSGTVNLSLRQREGPSNARDRIATQPDQLWRKLHHIVIRPGALS